MFKKIVIVEPVLITDSGKEKLKEYCEELVVFDTDTMGLEDTANRIGDADCILVSYKTKVPREVIERCKNLKHVALCCSYYGKQFAAVNIDALEERGITFSHLEGHGDNGVVEFTVAEVINLLHGFNGKVFKPNSTHDLTCLKVGILGLGGLGSKIANAFKNFGCEVFYFSRTRKPSLEESLGVTYLELDELLKTADVISINLNRDVCLIGGNKLEIFGNGKIIVNTAIGKCYEASSLKKWLENKNNFYVCDKASTGSDLEDILGLENVVYSPNIVGDTAECILRATEQILNNIKNA